MEVQLLRESLSNQIDRVDVEHLCDVRAATRTPPAAASAPRRSGPAVAVKYQSCQRYWSLIFSIGEATGPRTSAARSQRRPDVRLAQCSEKNLSFSGLGPRNRWWIRCRYGRIAEAPALLAAPPRRTRRSRRGGRTGSAPACGVKVWTTTSPERSPRPPGRRPGRAAGTCARSPGSRAGACDRSASTSPTRVTFGKVQPLADHLGADQDVDLSPPEVAEDLAEAVLACPSCRRRAARARARGSTRRTASSTRWVPAPASGCRGPRSTGSGPGPAARRRRGGSGGSRPIRW